MPTQLYDDGQLVWKQDISKKVGASRMRKAGFCSSDDGGVQYVSSKCSHCTVLESVVLPYWLYCTVATYEKTVLEATETPNRTQLQLPVAMVLHISTFKLGNVCIEHWGAWMVSDPFLATPASMAAPKPPFVMVSSASRRSLISSMQRTRTF